MKVGSQQVGAVEKPESLPQNKLRGLNLVPTPVWLQAHTVLVFLIVFTYFTPTSSKYMILEVKYAL